MAQTQASARAQFFTELLRNTRRPSLGTIHSMHGAKIIAAIILLALYLTIINHGGS